MAHLHNVYDSDIHFKLDLRTRLFWNESEVKTLVAQGDHNSERFTFEIPRYIESHDMTLCNRIEIHYININSATKETSQDVYIVDDMQVSPDDTNVAIFSWLLSNNATKFNGNLSFMIKFKCITNEIIDYQWSTSIYSKTQVCASYDHAEQVITNYSDVLEQWKNEVMNEIDFSNVYTKEESEKKFATKEELKNVEVDIDLSDYALKDEIPTDYAKSNHTHSEYASKEHTHNQYLTEHQDLSEYAKTIDITTHNTSNTSHNDIRLLIEGLTTRLNALANSDDTTLDQMAEVVAYIENNKTLIDSITTSKVNVSDIIDNLTSSVSNKPLSANQGVVLKGLIDTLQSSLSNYYKKTETYSRSEVDAKVSSLNEEIGNKQEKGDYALTSTLNSHTSNTTVHITSAERTKWNKVTTLSQDVESLKAKEIPNYVNTEAKRVADLVKSKQTVGSLSFTAMSDFHVEVDTTLTYGVANNEKSCRDAGFGLNELQKYCTLDFSALLGDYTWMDNAETTTQVKKDITFVKEQMRNGLIDIPNVWCTGNHDINYGTNSDRRMTEDEMFAYIINNNKGTVQDSNNIERNYGYIDFENKKIRCIYLNTVDALDYPDNTNGTADDAMEITAIQAQWLVDKALNLSDKADATKWGFVLLSHHCLSQFMPITAILTAYRNGASGNVDITTNGVTTNVSYNFTSGNRGEIICAIHGHDHNFTYRKISSERWDKVTEENAWLWSICIPNVDTTRNNEKATSTDTAYAKAFGEFDANGNPVYYPKTQDTATSTSFCVIVIDRKNKKIHAIHYGAGVDREVYYGEEIISSYPITYSLTKCTGASSNANSIDNGGTVTLTFTANSGCSLPDTVGVVGASHTWDKSTGTLVLSNPTSNVTVNITAISAYTNVIDTVGTEDGVRLRGVGTTQTGYDGFVSGYFEAHKNDIVRVYMPNGLYSKIPTSGNVLVVCDSSKTVITSVSTTMTSSFLTKTDNAYSYKVVNEAANFVRVAGGPAGGHTDWIVTVNEKIPQAPELD